MWCNNCLLIFPLRGGAMALAALIAAYSLAGAICLFLWGEFLWFGAYEYQVYGGISIAVMVCSLLLIAAFTNYSIIWTSALAYMLPFVTVISIIRAGLMVFRLDSFEENVVWECNNDRMLYNATVIADPVLLAAYDPSRAPAAVCAYGFHTLYMTFAVFLAIDCVLQLYQFFLVWCFRAFLRMYWLLKSTPGPILPGV
ncbi:hypothetical protein JCM8115_003604 [Rhodotorula mucilaginosa]